MYLLLFVIVAISTVIANPVPADEAHREKPLVFSLSKEDPTSEYRESAYRDQTVPDAGPYGTVLNELRIPNGITSEYPVGDMHLPLQATKVLDSAIANALMETGLHIPKTAYMDQESLYPGKKSDDGAQHDSNCGGSKSVCCKKRVKWGSSVLKECKHEKPGKVFPWGSPCQDPEYFDSCDKLWAAIDETNTSMDDNSDRRKVILKDGHPQINSQGITCYSDCKRPNPPN